MNYKYDLSFYEALDLVLNDECWVQGEDFLDGVVILLHKDYVMLKDFYCNVTRDFILSKNLASQKFRKVYTQPSAERRV